MKLAISALALLISADWATLCGQTTSTKPGDFPRQLIGTLGPHLS